MFRGPVDFSHLCENELRSHHMQIVNGFGDRFGTIKIIAGERCQFITIWRD